MSETFYMPADQFERTFNLPADQFESTVPLPHRGGHFVLSPNDHNMSASPDSNSNLSNLNEREAINMAECSPVGNDTHNATFGQGGPLCVVPSNLNQTFLATPVSGSSNFWNEGMNRIGNEQTESALHLHFNKRTEDEGSGEEMSPDSDWRQSQLSSCETSCRGSSENDGCSLSSGEMVIRSNSFCLEEESLIVISSLENSSISPAVGRLSFTFESNLLSTTLPDVCQKSTGGVTEEAHPCLGVTFTQADSLEFLTEENHFTTPSSIVALPSESEGGLMMTFICESPADPIKEAKSAGAEAESSPHLSSTFTPEQGMTIVSPMQRSCDIHTSTPVQNIGDNILCLPAASPSVENSSGHQPVKRQQVSLSHKPQPAAGLPFSLSKVKKVAVQKFCKLGLSSAKSNALTRAQRQVVVPGSASKQILLQASGLNKRNETKRGTPFRVPLAKSMTTVVSATPKLYDTHKQGNTKAANLGLTVRRSCGRNVVDGQSKTRASPADLNSAANNPVSSVHCTNTNSEMMQEASSRASDASALHAGSQTRASSLEKSPTASGQMDPKPTPKKDVSNKIEVRSGLALGQDKLPLRKTRPSCSSESSSTSRPPKKRTTFRVATSFTSPKADTDQGLNKPSGQKCPSKNKQAEETERPLDNSPREVKKISLVEEPIKSARDSCDESKSSHIQPSPKRERRTSSLSQPPPASPRPTPLSTRQRQGAVGKDECRIPRGVGTTPSQQKNSAGSQRTERPSLGNKPQLNGSWPPQTPCPTLMGPPPTTPSRLPRRTPGPSRGLADGSVHSELGQGQRSSSVSGGTPHKATPFKPMVLRSRLISTPGTTSGPSLTKIFKQAVSTNKGVSGSVVSPLKRTTNSRSAQPTSGGPVDKNKSKASSRQQSSQPNQSAGPQTVVQQNVTQVERKAQNVRQLPQLLTASNDRFQAVIVVLQQTLAERDEATRQRRELSQELVSLRGELVCSIHSSERLEKEKEDLRVALEDGLQRLQEQHQKDQAELEQRLQAFYQAEWDKARLAHQEEADKSKMLMQQQIEELKANHEDMKLKLENSHTEQLQCVKHQHETKLEELGEVHKQELQSLEKTLKDAEASLSGQIQKLTVENNALMAKLAAEENRRKELAKNSQKDSHALYLEQELESLKVVLEMKNKQLHLQEKKLMEVDKLTEKNVKLDESLIKVQQENEDLKARMERHAALSRQLSTEQVMLQESLQKESKVNKRLSMENEELLWKLHNGDLSSPRKLSPSSSSPSHSFSLHSPRSSGHFASPPLSPR